MRKLKKKDFVTKLFQPDALGLKTVSLSFTSDFGQKS